MDSPGQLFCEDQSPSSILIVNRCFTLGASLKDNLHTHIHIHHITLSTLSHGNLRTIRLSEAYVFSMSLVHVSAAGYTLPLIDSSTA